MNRTLLPLLGIAVIATLGLGACTYNEAAPTPPQPVTVVSPAPVSPVAVSPVAGSPMLAPNPPPAPMSELVPPPPQGLGPAVWQPGHWRYTGAPGSAAWVWVAGQYAAVPPGQSTWVPGQWSQQPGGGWAWIEGHWA